MIRQGHLHKLLVMLAFGFQMACSAQPELTNATTPIAEMASTSAVTYEKPIATATMTPQVIATSTATLIPTVTLIPTPIYTVTPETALGDECPTIIGVNESPIWSSGSFLFNTGKMLSNAPSGYLQVEQPGIWAISSNDLLPQPIYEYFTDALLSPDSSWLFHIEEAGEATREAVFYNILTNETVRLEFSPTLSLFSDSMWLLDGRLRHEIILERTEGVGEVREIFILDPITKQVEWFVEELDLPDYTFSVHDIERGISSGYDSVDPTGQFVLYTARRGSDNKIEIRLLDLQTGEVVWRQETKYLPSTSPEWDNNGSRVLFEASVGIGDRFDAWQKVVSLTRDGQVESIPPQPFPKADENITRFSRSPDGQYIFYSAFDFAGGITYGFIVDTATGDIKEICDPGTTFVTGFQGTVEGFWLQQNQFVYRILTERGGEQTHSLRVLDIPSWTVQIIFESSPGYGVNVFGWTPHELH